MSAHWRSLQDETGIAMVYVVIVMMVMTLIAFTTLQTIQNEETTSATQSTRQTAYQAAEAGINDYLAKLAGDPQYYSHYVTAAESTRRNLPTSATVAAATTCTATSKPIAPAWPYATVLAAAAGGHPEGDPEWDYPNGKDHWCQTTNGFEYNLQITPPTSASAVLTIVSTGRKTGATSSINYRVIQTVLSPNSITRYYRIVDGNVGFGSTTTTAGMVWANGNINHDGIAQANLYATGSITGSVSMQGTPTAEAPGPVARRSTSPPSSPRSATSRAPPRSTPPPPTSTTRPGTPGSSSSRAPAPSRRRRATRTAATTSPRSCPRPTARRCRPTTCRRTGRSTRPRT